MSSELIAALALATTWLGGIFWFVNALSKFEVRLAVFKDFLQELRPLPERMTVVETRMHEQRTFLNSMSDTNERIGVVETRLDAIEKRFL